jgi:hypothetical protein
MKIYLLIILLTLTTACEKKEKFDLSEKDIKLARCVCLKFKEQLVDVYRRANTIYYSCTNSHNYYTSDDMYTDGCQ